MPVATNTQRKEAFMARTQLRVYYGPQNEAGAAATETACRRDMVTVPLGEIFPLLADAVRSERTWLRDFRTTRSRSRPTCTKCILAYQHYRRPSA